MYLRGAQKAFQENTELMLNPQRDPVLWNLSEGLRCLALGLEQELARIEALLQDLQSGRSPAPPGP
jgi:hypothetical protein